MFRVISFRGLLSFVFGRGFRRRLTCFEVYISCFFWILVYDYYSVSGLRGKEEFRRWVFEAWR